MYFTQQLANNLSTPWLVIVVLGGCVAVALIISLVCHVFLRKYITREISNNFKRIFEVTAITLGIALSFLVVAVWQRYTEVQNNIVAEANAARILYRQSAQLPPAASETVQNELNDYLQTVIEDEWPLLARGQESPQTIKEIDDLWVTILAQPETTFAQVEARSKLIDSLGTLNEAHRTRIFESRNVLPSQFWTILLLFSVLIFITANTFIYHNLVWRLLAVGLIAIIIGLMFLLIILTDYPFSGSTSIKPDALRYVQELL